MRSEIKREENNRSEYILEKKSKLIKHHFPQEKLRKSALQKAKQNISSSYINKQKNKNKKYIKNETNKCTDKLRWPFKRINESEILLLTRSKKYD